MFRINLKEYFSSEDTVMWRYYLVQPEDEIYNEIFIFLTSVIGFSPSRLEVALPKRKLRCTFVLIFDKTSRGKYIDILSYENLIRGGNSDLVSISDFDFRDKDPMDSLYIKLRRLIDDVDFDYSHGINNQQGNAQQSNWRDDSQWGTPFDFDDF